MATSLRINGASTPVSSPPDTPVLWLLRGELGLTGTKFGCGMALCGACTVHVDGQPVRSCITPLSALGAAELTTLEGLKGAAADAVRAAWIAFDVAQCGYCQSGQVMAAAALLARNRQPGDEDIDAAMGGNLCRCGSYPRIRAAIHAAARTLQAL